MFLKKVFISLCIAAFCVSLMVGCTPPEGEAPAENGATPGATPGTTAVEE